MLVSTDITVARRLLGQSPTWADYARAILKEAHNSFTVYGRLGTGPWYVVCTPNFRFKMCPFPGRGYHHRFCVTPSEDEQYWIFEVIA